MDALEFDRRFARFVSQVDSTEMRLGAELFEAGFVRLGRVEAALIDGSVNESRRGVFRVALRENKDGGFSGSCECPVFFNCRHSYALARAARERVVSARQGPAALPRQTATRTEAEAALEKRLGRPIKGAERLFAETAQRCWKRLRESAWIAYPADLSPFVDKVALRRLPPAEPLREVKRLLGPQGAADPMELLDVLKAFSDGKGLKWTGPFLELLDTTEAARRALSPRGRDDSEPGAIRVARIRPILRLERADESNWFYLSAAYHVEGETFSSDELDHLIKAEGGLARLEGRGWLRGVLELEGPMRAALQAYGLDPQRRNAQRVHSLQLEDLRELGVESAELDSAEARESAAALASVESPEASACLRGVLRPYQMDGFRFLARLSQLGAGGILADDMGLGKTLQTLAWLLWVRDNQLDGKSLRVLIVCPKSVTDNWIQESAKFHTGLICARFASAEAGSAALADANLVVANYAQLRQGSDYFLGQEWDVAVLDEAQYIKSPEAQTTRVAWKLRAARRLALSGTPIENGLLDLWSLMRFVMPRLLGPQAAFEANYDRGMNEDAMAALQRRIRPFALRRLKSEVARELPARIEEEIHCEMEQEQLTLYQAELESARKLLADSATDAAAQPINVLNVLLRLRQICCDPRLIGAPWPSEALPCKLQALLDIVEPLVAEGHKVLVFSQFVAMLARIEDCLTEHGIGSLLLTGKTRDRAGAVHRFQSEADKPVFLLSLKAAGSGLNLTAASYVVLYDPWWNPAVENQAIDRAHRIGQINPVVAYRLLAKGTVEEKIRRIQAEKAELAQSIFGDGKLAVGLDLQALRALLD